MSVIRNIVESRIYDAKGDFNAAMRTAERQILSLMPLKGTRELLPEDVSVRDLYDLFVIEPRKQKGQSCEGLLGGNSQSTVAMVEAMGTTALPRIIGRMATIIILDEYQLALSDVEQLVTDSPGWTGDWAEFGRLTGKDKPERVHEGESYEEAGFGEFTSQIKMRKFGKIIYLTKEMILADQTGKIVDHAKNYGEAMGLHRQTDILECATMRASTLHEGGVNDWYRVNQTSYAVYADDHSAVPGSGAQTNDNIAAVALGNAGLGTIRTQMRAMKDINGDNIVVNPRFVIVAPEQETIAEQLHDNKYQVGATTQDLPKNIWKGKYMPINDFGGTDGTFFIGDFPKQMRYAWVWKPGVETVIPQEQAVTRDVTMLIKTSYKGGVGHIDSRYVLKSVAP